MSEKARTIIEKVLDHVDGWDGHVEDRAGLEAEIDEIIAADLPKPQEQ